MQFTTKKVLFLVVGFAVVVALVVGLAIGLTGSTEDDSVTAPILNCDVEGAVITCAYSEKNNLVIYDGSPTDDEESRDLDIFRINENCYEVDFKSKASF